MIDAVINWAAGSKQPSPKSTRQTFCEILHISASDDAIIPNITETMIADALISYKTNYAELIIMREKLRALQKQCVDNVFKLDPIFIEDSECETAKDDNTPAHSVDLNIVFHAHNTRTLINRLLVNIENNDALLQ